MNIANHFITHAQSFPKDIAIVTHRQTVSYDELLNLVEGKAAYFYKKGIRKGQRVLLFAPMDMNLYACILALFKLGAVVVIVDEWSSKERIIQSIRTADCHALLTAGKMKFLSYFFKATRSLDQRLSTRKTSRDKVSTEQLSVDDPALITFTTGSTNTPKAAVRTHGFLNIQLDTISRAKGTQATDIELIHLPILLLLNLANGCASCIPKLNKKSFAASDWKGVIRMIEKNHVNCITCSPAFLTELNNYTNERITDKIKRIHCGGGPVTPQMAKNTLSHFHHTEAFAVYGSTEAEPISIYPFSRLANNDILNEGGLCVGEVHPSIDSHIEYIEVNGEALNFGEIWVTGEHVLDNYFKDIGRASVKTERNGKIWHKTGDLGFYRDGQLYFAGRINQFIPSTKTPPLLIEEYILSITGHQGILIEKNSEVILCVEKINSSQADELSTYLSFDRIFKMTDLPKDPRHQTKIDYRKIQDIC